jgi:hypothetical protein
VGELTAGGIMMFHQVKQFVTTFRELEKREIIATREEEDQRQRLRHILAVPQPQEISVQQVHRRILAIAGFYPQAGASFIASNFACYQAGRDIHTTLCEMPDGEPYFYFALDSEERGEPVKGTEKDNAEKTVFLQNGQLRVKAISPLSRAKPSHSEIASWFLASCKDTSMLIIDLSSHWQRESAEWIMEVSDEIWFVCDTDIPRLARTIVTQEPPEAWSRNFRKIRLIANKWNHTYAKSSVIKKLEGTISLWNKEHIVKRVDMLVPLISYEKVTAAQIKSRFLLETSPEEGNVFAQLASLM